MVVLCKYWRCPITFCRGRCRATLTKRALWKVYFWLVILSLELFRIWMVPNCRLFCLAIIYSRGFLRVRTIPHTWHTLILPGTIVQVISAACWGRLPLTGGTGTFMLICIKCRATAATVATWMKHGMSFRHLVSCTLFYYSSTFYASYDRNYDSIVPWYFWQ